MRGGSPGSSRPRTFRLRSAAWVPSSPRRERRRRARRAPQRPPPQGLSRASCLEGLPRAPILPARVAKLLPAPAARAAALSVARYFDVGATVSLACGLFERAGGSRAQEMRVLDPNALAQHLDRLYRAAWALCGSREDAEDLVQETFARVLSRPRVLRGENELYYLLRVLRNTYLSS